MSIGNRFRDNALYVHLDGIAIGIVNSVQPFLPVLIARLGGSNMQVGLVAAMPALMGLLLSLWAGRVVSRATDVLPWFLWSRSSMMLLWTLAGVVPLFVPQGMAATASLMMLALATLPGVFNGVTFTLIMNGVAGPHGRVSLMGKRWTIVCISSAISVAISGQILDALPFPENYAVVFTLLGLGNLLGCHFMGRVSLPASEAGTCQTPHPSFIRLLGMARREGEFLNFNLVRFVFSLGVFFAAPLIPLYYVHNLELSDSMVGMLATGTFLGNILGYMGWGGLIKARGARFVLLVVCSGFAVLPALLAMSTSLSVVLLISILTGLFNGGVDLIFFEESLRLLPSRHRGAFIGLSLTIQNLYTVIAPIFGTFVAEGTGIAIALCIGAAIRVLGTLLFFFTHGYNPEATSGSTNARAF